jgi:hypothetical protein
LPDEQLAIKSDKSHWYPARDAKTLKAGHLLPRESEQHKSAWAFTDELGRAPERPSLELQALGMFLHAFKTQPRNQVTGVRFPRSELDAGWVTEENAPHPVIGLETTHRSLTTGTAGVARTMLNKCSFQQWTWTRDMLIDTLREMVEKDLIATDYKDVAAAILATV